MWSTNQRTNVTNIVTCSNRSYRELTHIQYLQRFFPLTFVTTIFHELLDWKKLFSYATKPLIRNSFQNELHCSLWNIRRSSLLIEANFFVNLSYVDFDTLLFLSHRSNAVIRELFFRKLELVSIQILIVSANQYCHSRINISLIPH